MSSDYQSKAVDSLKWVSAAKITSQVISWLATFLVIRLLDPTDYGVMAIAEVISALLLMLSTSGMGDSLIQAKTLDRQQKAKIFGLLVLICSVFLLMQVASANWLANFYEIPELEWVLYVMACNFILLPLIAMPNALLSRELEFKKKSILEVIVTVLTITVTLVLAFLDFGYWALVIGQVSHQLFKAVGLQIICHERMAPKFSSTGVKQFIAFGLLSTAISILWLVSNRAGAVIGGKFLTVIELGFYAVAFQVASLPMVKVVPVINQVTFPLFSRYQNSRDDVDRFFSMKCRLITLIIFPIALGLAAVAEPFTSFVLGEKWLAVAPIMFLLCLSIPFRVVMSLYTPLLKGLGKPGLAALNLGIQCLILIPAIFYFIQYKAIGIAYAWLIASVITYLVSSIITAQQTGISKRSLFGAVAPAAVCAVAMLLVVRLFLQVVGDDNLWWFIAAILLGGSVYLLLLLSLFRGDLKLLLSMRGALMRKSANA